MPNVIVRRPRTEQPQGPVPLRKELYENLLGYFPNSGNDLPTHPLTFAGNATYGVTEFGRATKFDGSGDYTSAGDAFYSDEYTILVTVNANLLNADPKGIIVKRNIGTGAGTNEIWLTATSTTVEMYAWQSGGTRILTLQSSLVPVAGQTYTIGIDMPPGSGTAYMYINGVLVASASKTGVIVNGTAELQFGALGSGVAARYWDGYIGPAAFWSKQLPNTQELTVSPWAVLEDKETPVWFSAATGSVTLGQATETDTAQALSSSKVTTLGGTTGTDNAQALSVSKSVTAGTATSSDAAQTLTSSKNTTVSVVSGTDAAQALQVSKSVTIGTVTDTSTAQALTTGGGVNLGTVTDTSTAQALTTSKVTSLSQVTSIDTPVAVSVSKSYSLGIATETDTSVALTAVKSLQAAVSTDTATALNTSKSVTIGTVVDMLSVQPLSTSHTVSLTQVVSTHTALDLTASGGTVLSLSQADLNAIATAVWAKAVEGLKAEEMMRIMLAALAGKREGLGTPTEKYMAVDGVTPRITLTPDANGNGTPTLNGAP